MIKIPACADKIYTCCGSRGYGTQNVPFEYDLILNRAGLLNLSNKEKENMTVRVSKTQV